MTLELVILAPGLLALFGLVIVGGRIEVASGAVEQASAAAARAASLARTPTTADAAARTAAHESLTGQNLHCTRLTVTVDAAGFAVPVGQAAQVTATVSCALDLAALSVPGVPGSKTLTSRTVSVLDRYRSRSLGAPDSGGSQRDAAGGGPA
jgi:Flp pilus assembly protein TadG